MSEIGSEKGAEIGSEKGVVLWIFQSAKFTSYNMEDNSSKIDFRVSAIVGALFQVIFLLRQYYIHYYGIQTKRRIYYEKKSLYKITLG